MTQPAFLTDPALGHVWDVLPEARVVGGAVRDALAGRAVVDIDLATSHPPADTMAALRQAGVKVVPTGLGHGTVTAVRDEGGQRIVDLDVWTEEQNGAKLAPGTATVAFDLSV